MITLSRCIARARRAVGLASVSLLCAIAAPAQASLNGTSVNVLLASPNGLLSDNAPISAADTVTVSPGVEFTPGDGSNVGAWLISGATAQESIDIQDFSIALRLLQGDPSFPDQTGYAAGARYTFSNLFFPGSTITGVSLTASGIANLNQGWVTLDNPSQVSFALDQIRFVIPASGTTYGDVTIHLATAPVPEPGSLALGLAGLALLGAVARARGRSSSA